MPVVPSPHVGKILIRPFLVEQKIVYTDFPFDYEFYMVDVVMMIKTEY